MRKDRSRRLVTLLTGAAAVLTAACVADARADTRPALSDRSRGFFGFAEWDSRFGGNDRDRRPTDAGRPPDRRSAEPRRDEKKGPPAFGPGGFGRFTAPAADQRAGWRPGGDRGRESAPAASRRPAWAAEGGDWRRGVTRGQQRGRVGPAWGARFGDEGRGRGGPAWGGRGGSFGRGGPAFAQRGWSSQRQGTQRCGFASRTARGGRDVGNWRAGFGAQRRGPAFVRRGWSGQRPGMARQGFSSRQGRGGPGVGNWRRGFAPSPRFGRGMMGFRSFGPGGRFGFSAPGRGGRGFDGWRDFRRPQARPVERSRPAAPPERSRPAAPPERKRPAAPPAAPPRATDVDRRIDNLLREIDDLRRQLRR